MDYEDGLAQWGRAANEEISGLRLDNESLGYQLIAADQALLNKNAEIEYLLSAVEERDAIITARNATVRGLKTRLDWLETER
jgi:hypothetical protein